MKPVRVTMDVPYPPEHVYDFLDVMANHEPFTNHMLRGWEYSGPPSGIGSKAKVEVHAAGRSETVDIEVIDSTRIAFEYGWQQAPLSDRAAAPIVRAILRRANNRSMARLAEELASRDLADPG